MHVAPKPDSAYERFQLIVNGPALFNAIVTGLELGVFSALSAEGPCARETLLERIPIAEHKLRVLLHALCTTGLVTKTDDLYANAPLADALLASDAPDSWSHVLRGWQKIYYPAFAEMTAALRSGTNTALAAYTGEGASLYQRLAHDPEREAILHASMSAFTLCSLPGLLENADLSRTQRLLDVGGGDGTTARHLADRWPGVDVTIFDTPSVTRLAESSNSLERIALQPGDLFDDPFPEGFDAILFSHVLEVFSERHVLELLSKAYDALPPGGIILIYGFNAGDDERTGVLSARLSLYLNVLASGEGMAYPLEDYDRWLREVGCTDVRTVGGLDYEHGLSVGTKAA